ncbi:ATPase, T2SS/T4P/T4SS family, partial [Alcaligenes pakistanensis]
TRLQASVCAEAVGLGPLEPLLADSSVSEIMVNRYDRVFVEQAGRLKAHPLEFSSESALRAVIDRILAPLGRRLDISSPAVDGRLADGSRFHAVLSPIAVKGTCVTIRKFPKRRLGLEDLL